MTVEDQFTFGEYVQEQMGKARDGAEILAALEPDLPWEDVKNLVGEKVLMMSFDEGNPGLGDRKLRVTCAREDGAPFRFSTEHGVLIKNIETLGDYLPCWITIEKTTSGSGREYFQLSKEGIPF